MRNRLSGSSSGTCSLIVQQDSPFAAINLVLYWDVFLGSIFAFVFVQSYGKQRLTRWSPDVATDTRTVPARSMPKNLPCRRETPTTTWSGNQRHPPERVGLGAASRADSLLTLVRAVRIGRLVGSAPAPLEDAEVGLVDVAIGI